MNLFYFNNFPTPYVRLLLYLPGVFRSGFSYFYSAFFVKKFCHSFILSTYAMHKSVKYKPTVLPVFTSVRMLKSFVK